MSLDQAISYDFYDNKNIPYELCPKRRDEILDHPKVDQEIVKLFSLLGVRGKIGKN